MSLVVFSQSNKIFKLFNLKLYRLESGPFRTQSLDFLVQNFGPFIIPIYNWDQGLMLLLVMGLNSTETIEEDGCGVSPLMSVCVVRCR